MNYMGSKRRIAKHIVPIMLEVANQHNITTWVEPFVGGGNLIDKIPSRFNRVGYDINPHTIMALVDIRDNADNLPTDISQEYYNSLRGTEPSTITSYVRIACSFGGIFESALAKGGKQSNGKPRNYAEEAKRSALKQQHLLQGVSLQQGCYSDIKVNGAIIYCDPPYQGTSGYKTGDFNHEEFFEWCRKMSENNIVFVSEYNAPSDFKEVWSGEIKTNFASSRKKATHTATEKLFLVNDIEIKTEFMDW